MNILLSSALVFNLITSLSCPIVNSISLSCTTQIRVFILLLVIFCAVPLKPLMLCPWPSVHSMLLSPPNPPEVLRGCCHPCGSRELAGGRGSVWRLVSEPLAPDTQTVLRGPLWMWRGCQFALGLHFCVVLSQGCRRAGLCTPTRQRSRGRASASAQPRWRPSCRSSRGPSGLTSWNSRESGKGCSQDGAGVRPWTGKQGI